MSDNEEFKEVLYTINKEGERKWVYSGLVRGHYFKRRVAVAYLLMLIYLLVPWIEIGGEQAVYFDLANRQFYLFGSIFWASDTQLLFLLLASLALMLFFFTSLLGRVWCGWACPETVFLEFLYRPIERIFEGNESQRKRLDQQPWNIEKFLRKGAKLTTFAVCSWILASTALAYFIGRDVLLNMMTHSPFANPGPFVATLFLMGILLFQFGWFREQFCTVLCPYARFQSVLMDQDSITVGYDRVRGEPRHKLVKGSGSHKYGDCIDCGLCVRVCPTGIDIRNGLQLECVNCTACIDACDYVMTKVNRPMGLIRYDSERNLLGKEKGGKRVRPYAYALLVCVLLATLVWRVENRVPSDFQVIRGPADAPFQMLSDGRVSNHLHARIANKGRSADVFRLALAPATPAELVVPLAEFPVEAQEIKTYPFFLNFSRDVLIEGKLRVTVEIESDNGYRRSLEVTLLGPGK